MTTSAASIVALSQAGGLRQEPARNRHYALIAAGYQLVRHGAHGAVYRAEYRHRDGRTTAVDTDPGTGALILEPRGVAAMAEPRSIAHNVAARTAVYLGEARDV